MRHFAPDELCPQRLSLAPADDLERYWLFSGHYMMHQLECVPAPATRITLLREPRARLLSMYYFLRSHGWAAIEETERERAAAGAPPDPSPRLAKELDLKDYLQCDDFHVRLHTDNAMTRHFAGAAAFDAAGRPTLQASEAVGLALKNLQAFDAFGLVEHYTDASHAFKRATGLDFGARLPQDNTLEMLLRTASFDRVERPRSFDAETEGLIRERTALDDKLYRWALEHRSRA